MLVSDAAVLARTLMNEHGFGHWTLNFDRAVRRAGYCSFRRQRISLSHHFVSLNPVEEVKDTILHEIAHALDGPRPSHHAHDERWKAICKRIGCRPERCYKAEDVVMPPSKWLAICGGCQREFPRHRYPKRQRYCAKCGRIHGVLIFKLRREHASARCA